MINHIRQRDSISPYLKIMEIMHVSIYILYSIFYIPSAEGGLYSISHWSLEYGSFALLSDGAWTSLFHQPKRSISVSGPSSISRRRSIRYIVVQNYQKKMTCANFFVFLHTSFSYFSQKTTLR
ncbi:MAG: hypothetical protein KBS70_05990 [Bacteroidales bacterium]|nr:hypothetical protein [Candidatus Colicola equi]